MNKEKLQAALEAISKSGVTVKGDLVLEKHVDYEVANVENGGIGIQITNGVTTKSKATKSPNKNEIHSEKNTKSRETMTFKRKSTVLDGHLTLLFNKLTKEGWIKGNEADFKALFSGKRDEDCELIWLEPFGKAVLFSLFSAFCHEGLVFVPNGYAISSILEGHFKDKSGQWVTGLDKGNKPHVKAYPVIMECVKLLQIDAHRLAYGNNQDDEDFQAKFDPFDHQDLNLHHR